jgi:Mrp family chromosome partitioning ATPase/uncharacterized protein involved in exopolysaccharide biosynthesis
MITSDRLLEATRRSRFWIVAVIGAALATTLLIYAVSPRTYTAEASLSVDPAAVAQGSAIPALRQYLTSSQFSSNLVEGPLAGQSGARREGEAWQKGLAVKQSGTTGIALVAYSAETALLAARLVNGAVDQYVADQRAADALAARLDTLRADLGRVSGAIEQQRMLVGETGSGTAATRALVADLDGELAAAKADVVKTASRIWPYPATVFPAVRELRNERERLEAYRAGLSSRYGPLHPTLIAAEREVADVDRRIAEQVRKLNDAKAATQAAELRAAAAEAALGHASLLVGASEAAHARLAELQRRSDAIRSEYQLLRSRVRDGRKPPVPAQLLARASVSSRRSSPDLLLLATGAVLASLIGAAGVVLAHVRGSGFRSPRDLENTLGITLIGAIPDIKLVSGYRARGGDRIHPPEHLTADPTSAFGSAIRDLLGRLREEDDRPQAIAICSALPNEGKTTLSICLALSAAFAGEKVVLVDCDGRRRAVSRAMAPDADVGLIECLKGKVPLEHALARDSDSGAWLLPQSEAGGVDADAIGSESMENMIHKLRESFDLVLLDTGPVLALAEARAVAGMVDSVLLVARWRETPVTATRLALDLLRRERARVIGATLTLVGNGVAGARRAA